MATKYTLVKDSTATDFTRSKKDTVIAEAERVLLAKEAFTVSVVTNTGTEVFKAARRKVQKKTTPYTRVVELTPELQALVPEGYAAAYARLRQNAIVLRREIDIEDDPSRYKVLNSATNEFVSDAETTREAGRVMKGMAKAKA